MPSCFLLCILAILTLAGSAKAQGLPSTQPAPYPPPMEADGVLQNFRFHSGQQLPELKLHYYTLGTPRKDAAGVVRNAVLILHGTGGSGKSLLTPQFAGVLFKSGGVLDANRFFIVLSDGIGHGRSSKPSDGLHMKFPKYTYDDMVLAQYRLLTERLGVNHLRLVMGTSMGGMHTWVWGETYPDFMDALMPLASLPVQIAGRNRMWRRMVIDDIENDPAWNKGEYTRQPKAGLSSAAGLLLIMGSSPLQYQKQAPTRPAAEKFMEDYIARTVRQIDANDTIYQFDASREYNPATKLESIKAPLLAINSADDQINPPELGIMERQIKHVPGGRFILIPISDQTRGHGTHSYPAIWQQYLKQLLDESERR